MNDNELKNYHTQTELKRYLRKFLNTYKSIIESKELILNARDLTYAEVSMFLDYCRRFQLEYEGLAESVKVNSYILEYLTNYDMNIIGLVVQNVCSLSNLLSSVSIDTSINKNLLTKILNQTAFDKIGNIYTLFDYVVNNAIDKIE